MAGRGFTRRGFASVGRGGSSGSSSQDKIKLGVAVALLVVAGAILAWYFGIFATTPTPPPPAPETIQAIEQTKQENQQAVESGRAQTSGSE